MMKHWCLFEEDLIDYYIREDKKLSQTYDGRNLNFIAVPLMYNLAVRMVSNVIAISIIAGLTFLGNSPPSSKTQTETITNSISQFSNNDFLKKYGDTLNNITDE
jgi:hypothetical protein